MRREALKQNVKTRGQEEKKEEEGRRNGYLNSENHPHIQS